MPPTDPNQPYDPTQLATNLVMACRLWAADTNYPAGGTDNFVFADAEVQYALGNYDDDPILAAADLLQMVANDKARLAIISSKSSGNTDASQLSDVYSRRAQELRAQADIAPVIVAPCQVFSTNAPGVRGTMDVW